MTRNMAACREVLGDEADVTHNIWRDLIGLMVLRKDDRGTAAVAEVLNEIVKSLGENHPHVLDAKIDMARAVRLNERYADAESMLHAAHEHAEAVDHERIVTNLSELYEAWGRPDAAKRGRAGEL